MKAVVVKQTFLVDRCSKIRLLTGKSVKSPLKSNRLTFLSSQERSFMSYGSNKLQITENQANVLASRERDFFVSHDRHYRGRSHGLKSRLSNATTDPGANYLSILPPLVCGNTWCFTLAAHGYEMIAAL